MILVNTKRFTQFFKSHGGVTENDPFTVHKNIAYMVGCTMIDVNSEQGQSVI